MIDAASGAVLQAVASGRITPSEAVVLTGLIEAQRCAIPAEPPPAPVPIINVGWVEPEPGNSLTTLAPPAPAGGMGTLPER